MAASASVFSSSTERQIQLEGGREASLFWDCSALDERQNQTEGLVPATSTSLARMGEESKRGGAAVRC